MISKSTLYTVYIENLTGTDVYFNVAADTFNSAVTKANAILKELEKDDPENKNTYSITNIRTADIDLWTTVTDDR